MNQLTLEEEKRELKERKERVLTHQLKEHAKVYEEIRMQQLDSLKQERIENLNQLKQHNRLEKSKLQDLRSKFIEEAEAE